ncbi:MAG: hypothetical protein ACI87E_004896 [Mariniblastus sp.]|jgi:hypothetical protein
MVDRRVLFDWIVTLSVLGKLTAMAIVAGAFCPARGFLPQRKTTLTQATSGFSHVSRIFPAFLKRRPNFEFGTSIANRAEGKTKKGGEGCQIFATKR